MLQIKQLNQTHLFTNTIRINMALKGQTLQNQKNNKTFPYIMQTGVDIEMKRAATDLNLPICSLRNN